MQLADNLPLDPVMHFRLASNSDGNGLLAVEYEDTSHDYIALLRAALTQVPHRSVVAGGKSMEGHHVRAAVEAQRAAAAAIRSEFESGRPAVGPHA